MTTFTTRDGVELAYQDSGVTGDGVPLVMLHGWGQTQAMFRHQLADLAARRRVVTVDQRGHGTSAKPHHGYRIARFARDAQELLDHLGIDRADVLGWAMGVSVWWSFIDQYGTGRIRSLVAVDQPAAVAAVPWMSEQEQADSGAIFDVAALVGLGAALHGPEGHKATLDFVRSMFSGDTDPDVWAFVEQEIGATPAYAAVPLLWDHCAQDWRDVLPRIDVPTPRHRLRRQPRRPGLAALHRRADPRRAADVGLPAGHPSDLAQARRALHTLARFTSTPQDCWFCAWEGFSDVVLPPEVELLDLPHRRYALLRGSVADIDGWTGTPPAFAWPADRSWCFTSDVDPHWAGIGGSQAAVDAIVADPELDAVAARPSEPPIPYR